MEFGLFYQLPTWPDQDPAQRYENTLEQIEHGDALGFHTAWLAELHFVPHYGLMPAPMLMAAAAAQRTSRIRIGTGVMLLPLHDPLRAAEEAAVLDVLSGGRLDFGVGRGGIPQHFLGYGVSLDERADRFNEALEVIQRAWADEPLNFSGRYYQYENVNVVPKPLQRPGPPIRVATNSPDSMERAARNGHPIMATPMTVPRDELQPRIAEYRRIRRELGHPVVDADICLTLPVHVARESDTARAEAEASLIGYMRLVAEVIESGHAALGPAADPVPPRVSRYRDTEYEQVVAEIAAVGSVDEVVAFLQTLKDDFGVGHIMCWWDPNGLMPQETVLRSMTLFMEEVAPRLR